MGQDSLSATPFTKGAHLDRGELGEFATAMSSSDMLDEFDKLVARSKSKP